jgi:hypothetical protein
MMDNRNIEGRRGRKKEGGRGEVSGKDHLMDV